MTVVRRSAVAILLSCVMVLAAMAQSAKTKEQALFYINNKPVTTEEFVYLYNKNHQHKPDDFTREKIEEYLDLFINYKLKVEEALFRRMDTTAAFTKEYRTYRDELLKPYTPDARVIDSLVRLTYDRLKEEVNASHILIRLDPDATPEDTLAAFRKITDIRQRAVKGEDFGALAAEFSEEPGVERTRGNLGFFTAMQMVFPFEQAAYFTPVGEISQPVRTKFGYHIVKVHDRQPSRGEVEISHIMVRAQDDASMSAARDRIFDIHDKLQKGMRWEELCAEYSEDLNTKDKGGKLRPFGVGAMAALPAFQDMAFSLQDPGDVSDPVQTQFGWHILRLESRIPLPSFEDLKSSLTQRVSRDERVTISREALRARMRYEFGYRENAAIRAALLNRADEMLDRQNNSIDIGDSILFTMGAKDFRVRQFADFVRNHRSHGDAASARQDLEELMTEFTEQVQMNLLEEKVRRESPEYKWLVKEYYEGILLFEIMERQVWNRAMEDTAGQRQYFAQNKDKYTAGERMTGKIYSASSPNKLEKLQELIADSAASTGSFLTAQGIKIDSGIYEQKDRSFFSRIPWSPGTYLTENGGVHFLVMIDKILPPGPQTFDEARASVISDYQSYLEDSWIRELKRKFVVKVEKKAKKRAFATLMNPKSEK